MKDGGFYEVIIVGGSYSGLAAAMALGRARKQVLVVDSGQPCNRQTPYSHNFLTRDGERPAEIAAIGRQQLERYDTVSWGNDEVIGAMRSYNGFKVELKSGGAVESNRLIFATGIRDVLPPIGGLAECWGISVLHCPYCHGYEVRDRKTGIIGRGEAGFDMVKLISNWTQELTLYSNGPAGLAPGQLSELARNGVAVVERKISRLVQEGGVIRGIEFVDREVAAVEALYIKVPFVQHCAIPEALGCGLTEEGYLKIDPSFETTAPGIYACGDNASPMRTVANAVAMGTAAGMMLSRKMIVESFN